MSRRAEGSDEGGVVVALDPSPRTEGGWGLPERPLKAKDFDFSVNEP